MRERPRGQVGKAESFGWFCNVSSNEKALICPFGPTGYAPNAPSTRMDLNVRMEENETFKYFRDVDTWAGKYLTEHSGRLFGFRALSEEQVLSKYHPCLKPPKDKFNRYVRRLGWLGRPSGSTR